MSPAALAEWSNFYVITGSAAAALTGLTFVVIALAADARPPSPAGLEAFVTPTIVHFGAVLLIATFMNVPHQTLASFAIGFFAMGVAGLLYVGVTGARIARISSGYVPVREDWLWNVLAPALAYAALLLVALFARDPLERSLYGVAPSSVLLLFIGIHNAWDVAVWNTVHLRSRAKSDESPSG